MTAVSVSTTFEVREARLMRLRESASQISFFLLRRDSLAQEYLLGRGIDDAVAGKYGLGVWNYDVIASLLGKREQAQQWELDAADITPKLNDRITIPAHSPGGTHILGFIGRTKPWSNLKPRYLYPPAATLSRRTHLLCLHDAFQHHLPYVIIVEGPFDALLLNSIGVPAVCTHGASFTKEQAAQITALGVEPIFLADGDPPRGPLQGGKNGLQAMRDSITKHRRALPRVTKLTACPLGKDPAVLAKESPEILRQVIESAKPVV